jgi:hypothetical protein
LARKRASSDETLSDIRATVAAPGVAPEPLFDTMRSIMLRTLEIAVASPCVRTSSSFSILPAPIFWRYFLHN